MAFHGMSHGIPWKRQKVCIIDFAWKFAVRNNYRTSKFGFGIIPGPVGKEEDKNAIRFR